jgi:uncharacterized repeat protein (TIGR03803 family)
LSTIVVWTSDVNSSASAKDHAFTVLYSFDVASGYGLSNLTADKAGNLYGTTEFGGGGDCNGQYGCGVVFKLAPDGTETALHVFTGGSDGGYPQAGVITDKAGNLYGTTTGGGAHGQGVIFKIAPDNTETILYSFSANGMSPLLEGNLLRDRKNNLYGTVPNGGTFGAGAVYKLASDGTFVVLHSFDGSDGAYPYGGVVQDKAGNLYGTASQGGNNGCKGGGGCGLVFKLAPDGTYTALYTFTGGSDGSGPDAGLILDGQGNVYGTIENGGVYDGGVVFKITPNGTESALYSFGSGNDGYDPECSLILNEAGDFYGTTRFGGAFGYGTVFKLTAEGIEKSLYSFTNGNDGSFPSSGVINGAADEKGNLYGTIYVGGASGGGLIYRLRR